MAYTHGDVVESATSPDGKSVVEFIARHDGLYEFRELREVTDDESELGQGISVYWQDAFRSGFYPTLSFAQADAQRVIAWLRDGRN